MEIAVDLQRDYMQAVLNWLDAILEREVLLWRLAGQDPADRFRGLHISGEDALDYIHQGPAGRWGKGQSIPAEEEQRLADQLDSAQKSVAAIEAKANQQEEILRLQYLSEIFNLDEFEWLAFLICLAPALDLRYERIFGYLQDDVTRVHATVDLILQLVLPPDLSRLKYLAYFEREAHLRQFSLIQPVSDNPAAAAGSELRHAFKAAPAVVAWILGNYTPGIEMGEHAECILPGAKDEEDAVSDIFSTEGMPSPKVFEDIQPLFSLYGPDRMQQDLTSRQIASALERPLLKVGLPADTEQAALELLQPAVRDARFLGALLAIEGADILIDHDGCLLPQAFTILRRVEDTVLLCSREPFKLNPDKPGNDAPLMRLELKALTSRERADLWSMMLDGVDENLPASDLDVLAGQFSFNGGQIVAASSSALSTALQEGRGLQVSDLFDAARLHSGHHLGELAKKIEPRYSWEDLVLPETPLTMLREMVSMVKSRGRVLEEWGLGSKLTASAGVSALFTGPPGTGKTLAAQIIAHELSIDLYRIDLSTIVSKYIGETEKNLERIFNEAATSNAILFFDEADAIFGKRSEVKDAHDRYANIEVGYLLQRMEAYDGVAILATNLRANLDEAFTRRLQFIVNFPFPEEEYRQHIWRVLMPPALPRANDLDFKLLAKRFKLAGGNIRNIIVSAAYLAAVDGGCVTMQHLMHGARREFQKMGRLVQENDFIL